MKRVVRVVMSCWIVGMMSLPAWAVALPPNQDGQIFTEADSASVHNTGTYFGMLYCRLGATVVDFPEFGGVPTWTASLDSGSNTSIVESWADAGNPVRQVNYSSDFDVNGFHTGSGTVVRGQSPSYAQETYAEEGPWNSWVRGYGFGGRAGASTDVSAVDFKGGGFITGIDKWVSDTLVIGVNTGFAASNVNLQSGTGKADIDSFHLGVHFRQSNDDDSYLIGAITWGHNEFDSNRRTVGARASYSGNEVATYSEYGKRYCWNEVIVAPFISGQHIYSRVDSFTESGGGLNNISVGDRTIDSFRGSIGCRLARPIQMSNCRMAVPEFRIQCTHEFLDESPASGTFAGGGSVFNGTNIGDTFIIYGLGSTVELSDHVSFFAHYDGQFADNFGAHVGSGGFLISW